MKCESCGAPLNAGDEVCEYCGTVTPYGEELNNELIRKLKEKELSRRLGKIEQHRKILEKMPAVHKVSIPVISLLYIITFGYYSHYWYYRWTGFISILSTKHKFLPSIIAGYVWSGIAFLFLPHFHTKIGLTYEQGHFIWSCIFYGLPVMSAWIAFRVRKILRDYAEMFVDRTEAELIAAPEGILLFMFGPLYLQYSINKMIDANMFKTV